MAKVCDTTCDCPLGETCLGRRFPDLFGGLMRSHWDSGNPVLRAHVLNRAALGYTPPDPPAAPDTPPDQLRPVAPSPPTYAHQWPPAPKPTATTIPLAGDLVAKATAKLGVDRLTKYVTNYLGVDCGCPERQRKLNELDRRLRRWLGMG